MEKILVLCGGSSNEREISLQSGEAVYQALLDLNFNVEKFDPAKNDISYLKNFRKVFICLHGADGEDGKIQDYLEKNNIAFNGSRAKASKLAMDKFLTKQKWDENGIKNPNYMLLNKDIIFEEVRKKIGLPFVVKPSNSGSSIGISIVRKEEDFIVSRDQALEIDAISFAEEFIEGREFTLSIIGNEELEIIEIKPIGGFYDYHAKYVSDDTQFICPADIEEKLSHKAKAICKDAFKALGCEDWGRVDFMIKESTKEIYIIEINTIPGMTSHSLLPMASMNNGNSFKETVMKIYQLIK
ncbi:MAG: D-alanine--D-alanine ligase [Nitrosomonadales bacterium]